MYTDCAIQCSYYSAIKIMFLPIHMDCNKTPNLDASLHDPRRWTGSFDFVCSFTFIFIIIVIII